MISGERIASIEMPMTATIRALLTPLVIGREPDESLFPVTSDWRYLWRRLGKRAGVRVGLKNGGKIPHSARRTFARQQRAAGISQSVVMEQAGWRSEAMFRRYGIVDLADKLAAQELVELAEQARIQSRKLQSSYNPQSNPLPTSVTH